MRTTIDLPDPLLRGLKSRAAMEGVTLKALLHSLIERGLAVPARADRSPARSKLPCVSVGHALAVQNPTNARLFQLLDEA